MLKVRDKIDSQTKALEAQVWSVQPKPSNVLKWKALEQKRRRYKEVVVDQWLKLSDEERAKAIQKWKAENRKF